MAARQPALVAGASGGIGWELAPAFATAVMTWSSPGWINKAGVQSVRISPRSLVTRLVGAMQAKRT
jgi:short-subunit dehydrogenase